MTNFTEVLSAPANRNTGKTYTLAKWALERNGVVVCHNFEEARRVAREYGCNTISLHQLALGRRGWLANPIMFDSTAVVEMELHYLRKLHNLQQAFDNYQNAVEEAGVNIAGYPR